MVLFASDLHLGHKNIVDLCNRPFRNVEEMDAALIENWNRKVREKDLVYLIGDAVWDKRKLGFYMEQLSGKKILVVGNHDSAWAKREECKAYFEEIVPYLEVCLNGHPITMCHYPMLEWNGSRVDSRRHLGYLIHGHIHNRICDNYKPLFLQFNALNAGVDINGYAPVTFDELVSNNMTFKLAALSSDEDKAYLRAMFSEI